jgi:hypothetical protein
MNAGKSPASSCVLRLIKVDAAVDKLDQLLEHCGFEAEATG